MCKDVYARIRPEVQTARLSFYLLTPCLPGFRVETQCLKLVIDANYGSFSTCINGVGFFGVGMGACICVFVFSAGFSDTYWLSWRMFNFRELIASVSACEQGYARARAYG